MIGLERGVLRLVPHEPVWAELAEVWMADLRAVLGSVAVDVQHVGSTAIAGIQAKPIVDLALAVESLAGLGAWEQVLAEAGFVARPWPDASQRLFAVGDYSRPAGVVCCFVHAVEAGSKEWRDYVNFRDYLRAVPAVAQEYEALKLELARELGRAEYLEGKAPFVARTLEEAEVWARMGRGGRVSKIEKGWSGDRKFRVELADGELCLLRLTPKCEKAERVFGLMKAVEGTGVPMARALDWGPWDEGAYMVQDWVEGEDLEAVLPDLSEREQYRLGVKAGEALRRIHVLPAPPDLEPWEARFNRKIDRKIELYEGCGLRFEGDEMIVGYLEAKRALLAGRPQCVQHGDYHVGNMMLVDGRELVIIDYDRYDYGDPWEEFNRIVWSAQASPAFARGQVRGYFGGEPPALFFELLALYIGSNTLSSLPWAVPFGEQEVQVMRKQAEDVLEWFNGMQDSVPTWYRRDLPERER